jgi:hypothetical protein
MNPVSLLTRGILGNARITNGFITYEITGPSPSFVRRRGGGGYATGYPELKKVYEEVKDDADCIKVTLLWKDRPIGYQDQKIYVEFVQQTITADLLLREGVNVEVELL